MKLCNLSICQVDKSLSLYGVRRKLVLPHLCIAVSHWKQHPAVFLGLDFQTAYVNGSGSYSKVAIFIWEIE